MFGIFFYLNLQQFLLQLTKSSNVISMKLNVHSEDKKCSDKFLTSTDDLDFDLVIFSTNTM